jgi:hypothetical protein
MVIECFGSLLLLNIVLAAWVLFDSLQRGAELTWALGTVVLGPVMLPVYRARRPLRGTEIRAGGPDWIVSRNFAWTWTLAMIVIVFWVALTLFANEPADPDAEQVANLQRGLALLFLSVCWIVPTGAALMFSLISFVDEDVEHGPDVVAPPEG